MRILMVSDVYFPRINGVSTSIQTFRDSLLQLGHDVELIAPHYSSTELKQNGVHRLKSRPVPFDAEDRLMKVSQVCHKIKQLHRKQAFDVMHIQTPFVAHRAGKHMARNLGIPCIETYHTHFEEYMHNYVPLVPRWVFRPLIRFITRRQCQDLQGLIVPSSAMLQVIRDYRISIPTRILPTGIDPDKFSKGDSAGFRHKHKIDETQPVMVHIGRIGHEKNIDFLFHVHQQVLRHQPDTILVLAGEGPALSHLKHLTKKLGIATQVRFVGYLQRDSELLDCYAAGNVFVFSSRTETQGLVLLEAMALGVPVVSTAVLGTRDILLPQRGALVAKEDVSEFSGKVLKVLCTPELQQRMSREGREYVHEWSHQTLSEKLVELYQHTIEQYGGLVFSRLSAEQSSS